MLFPTNDRQVNDNLIALNMLDNISAILKGIEFDDPKKIGLAFDDLRKNTERFQTIFYNNLVYGVYQTQTGK